MNVTKLCEVDDFADPALAEVARRLTLTSSGHPCGLADQRDWMAAMAVRGLLASEAVQGDARVLTVGSGAERVISVLAGRIAQVSATEWSGDWSAHREESFDALVCGPIDVLSDLEAVEAAVASLARTLKIGGALSLATWFRLHGPPGGIGWPGKALVLSAGEARRVVDASGLALVGALPEQVSDETLAARRDLRQVTTSDELLNGMVAPAGSVTIMSGYVFTMAHLLLRKTKESGMKRSAPAVTAGNRRRSARPASPATGPGWGERVVGLQERISRTDPLLIRSTHLMDLTSDSNYDVERSLTAIDQACRTVETRLSDASRWSSASDAIDGTRATTPAPGSMPDGHATCCSVRLAEGLTFSVVVDDRSADPITSTFLAGYCLFQDLVSLMLQLVSPGDAVLDVGAHLGTFTLAAAAAGSPVLAIEASPDNARLLRASVARNGFRDSSVVSAAASDQPGSVRFHAVGPWGTVVDSETSPLSIEVPAVTIDELLFELGFPRPRFVKMDVEGSEIRAMHGMAQLLSLDDAPALLLESNGHTLNLMGMGPSDLLREVEAFGYTAYFIDRARLIPVRSADLQPRTEVDYLALKQWPESLTAWALAPPLSAEERIAMLVQECRSQSEDCRAYVGRVIADAGPEVLAHSDVHAALGELAEDPAATVRAAVGWWSGSRRS